MPRPRHKPRKKPVSILSGSLAALLLGVGLIGILHWDSLVASINQMMPIRHVRIEGDFANVDPEELGRALLPLLRRNYAMLDLAALEQAAAGVSWVGSARVARIWPDTVVVDIGERTPVARWGSERLISEQGVVFLAKGEPAKFSHLPGIEGPVGHEVEVLGMLARLNDKFAARSTMVVELRLSDRLAWTAVLADGLEIVYGNRDPLDASDRMLAVLPRLSEQHQGALKRLDLRYPSGFAATWKLEPPPPQIENMPVPKA